MLDVYNQREYFANEGAITYWKLRSFCSVMRVEKVSKLRFWDQQIAGELLHNLCSQIKAIVLFVFVYVIIVDLLNLSAFSMASRQYHSRNPSNLWSIQLQEELKCLERLKQSNLWHMSRKVINVVDNLSVLLLHWEIINRSEMPWRIYAIWSTWMLAFQIF